MPENEVVLIGLGIPEGEGMTLLARRELADCRVVFAYNHKNPQLNEVAREVRTIGEFGLAWTDAVMNRFMRKVLAESRRGRVGLVVYGDPLVYEPLGAALFAACAKARVPCRVVPGVAAIGVVLAAAGAVVAPNQALHVGDEQVYSRRAPDPEAWTVVYKALQSRDIYARIIAQALTAFAPTHRVFVVEARAYGKGFTRRVTLGALARGLDEEKPYATLLIPPKTVEVAGVAPASKRRRPRSLQA